MGNKSIEKVGEMSLYSAIRAGPRGVVYGGGGGALEAAGLKRVAQAVSGGGGGGGYERRVSPDFFFKNLCL